MVALRMVISKPSPSSIETIIFRTIRIDREGQVRRIRHEEEIDVLEYQILTREIVSTLKPLEEIIRENIFCLGDSILPITWRNEGVGHSLSLGSFYPMDRGTRRGCQSTSSHLRDQPSLSPSHRDVMMDKDEGNPQRAALFPVR
ncbi:hypothetical protein Tco_1321889 [Tanacetum coccineum]